MCCFYLPSIYIFQPLLICQVSLLLALPKNQIISFSCKHKSVIIAVQFMFNGLPLYDKARKIVINIDWPFVQDNQNKNLFSTMLVCFDVYFQSLHYKVLCCILMRFQVRRSSVKLFCYIIQIKEISLWYRREVVKKQR